MSKITNITDGSHIQNQQPVKKTETSVFKNALDAALATKKNNSQSPSKTQAANSLGEIQSTTINTIESSKEGIFDKTNFLIDKLENYSKELENPEKSLKDIEPLITSIKDEAENLVMKAEGSEDSALNKIVTETAIKTNSEYIKFNRGDYI